MADRIQPRGPEGAAGWIASACRLILSFRAGVLLITLLSLPVGQPRGIVIAAILVAALACFVPLHYWDRVGPALVRQPSYLAGELVLAVLILFLTGTQSVFFFYTAGTALLGGLVYGTGGAVLFPTLLLAGYYWVLSQNVGGEAITDTFQAYVGLPALYVLAGAAGAGARRLLDRQAEAEGELTAQERLVAGEHERARLARDMHDSLAKTVHGMGFAARALSRQIPRDPEGAVRAAERLADDAKQAAEEARDLIAGLRAQGESDTDMAPADAARAEAERWSRESGIPVEVAASDVDGLALEASRELVWILRESLRNVSRHASGATRVEVRLRGLAGRAVLSVADDGPGFEVPDDLDALQAGRHYGLIGMRERARVVGGDLSVDSEPGEGMELSAWFPLGQAPQSALDARPSQAGPPAEPTRTVTGYTWH